MDKDINDNDVIEFLKQKSIWVRRETLKVNRCAPETRLASSLSDIEIFVALYYGKILRFDPANTSWEHRDRFIVSKGHGGVSLYPILADLGFFDKAELSRVCKEGSFLGGIPDTSIPGFETVNGSLGHGLGVACGICLAIKSKGLDSNVFVLMGDGELYEGSVWEAIMFASQHRLDNLVLIVDYNKISMLDYCRNIIDLTPLEAKFETFGWKAEGVDGHDVREVYEVLKSLAEDKSKQPKMLVAHTIKGKGVRQLETDVLCHVKCLTEDEIEAILKELH